MSDLAASTSKLRCVRASKQPQLSLTSYPGGPERQDHRWHHAQGKRKTRVIAAHRTRELGGDLLRLVADAELRDVALSVVRIERARQHADERRLARPILAQHHLVQAHTRMNMVLPSFLPVPFCPASPHAVELSLLWNCAG